MNPTALVNRPRPDDPLNSLGFGLVYLVPPALFRNASRATSSNSVDLDVLRRAASNAPAISDLYLEISASTRV